MENEVKKDESLPLVSVLVLSYNHKEFIGNAIDSIFKQYDYYNNIELIVMDDGSNDGTIDILKKKKSISPIPFSFIEKEHGGVHKIAKNLNNLIKLVNGKYVSFLASDDEYVPNRFIKQVELMEVDNNIKFVYANGINKVKNKEIGKVNDDSLINSISNMDTTSLLDYLLTNTSPFYLQSSLIRKDFLNTFIPFDEDLIADDWVFNIRAFSEIVKYNHSFSYLNEVVFYRNIHKTNTSSNDFVHYERISQVINKYTPIDKRYIFHKKIFKRYLKKSFKSLKIKNFFYFIYKFIENTKEVKHDR